MLSPVRRVGRFGVQSAQDIIDAGARELVRRRGIDPASDPRAVAEVVGEMVAEYQDRVSTSTLPPVHDPDAASRAAVDAIAGFGPLQPFLDDPAIEEIWINEPGRVFVARRGRSELTTLILTAAQVEELVERMLRTSGRRIDLSTPFVDAMLPDGSRLHVVIPNITRRHMAVNIRKFLLSLHSLDELTAIGSITPHATRFLEAAVVAGLNILVAGGTQAGKTTMLNALCGAIPGRERVVTVEEVYRTAGRAARRRRDADPAAESRGHRRDPVAPPRQGSTADAAVAPHRRRGAASRVPRPLDRTELGAAGNVYVACELSARGAGEDVHAAAAGRGERLGRLGRRRTFSVLPAGCPQEDRSTDCHRSWRRLP